MASLGYLQVVCYVTSLNNKKRKGRNRDKGVLLVLKLVLVGCPLFYLKVSLATRIICTRLRSVPVSPY